MYERFTDRARKVMQLADQEAERLHCEYIGSEHILLGLVSEGSGVAAHALENLDVAAGSITLEVERIVRSGRGLMAQGDPLTYRAKRVLEYSMEEARHLNHNYVGTEHLLMGLVRDRECAAARVLMNLGVQLQEVRAEVLDILGHGDC